MFIILVGRHVRAPLGGEGLVVTARVIRIKFKEPGGRENEGKRRRKDEEMTWSQDLG